MHSCFTVCALKNQLESGSPRSVPLPDGRLVNQRLCWVLVGQVLWPQLCHCPVPSSYFSSFFQAAAPLAPRGPQCQLFPSGAPNSHSTLANTKEDADLSSFTILSALAMSNCTSQLSIPKKLQSSSRGSRPPWNKSAWPLALDLSLGNTKLIALWFHS